MPASNVSALVLIYDIRGFTSASKRMRTADIGAFATAAHRTILDLFSERPPTFVKNLGDGHLLLWETGVEPDPSLLESVVKGAARARTAFAAFAAGQGTSGATLPKHVGLGIAFGEVSRSDDYYGTALNLAARLQNLARPEGIALDASVFEAVARRDAALVTEFKRARVRLKGLGQTLVWVKRPFSWARLGTAVAKVAAVVAVPAAYAALCDAGLPLPLGEGLRRFLDRHEASLLRPVRAEAGVREEADRLRRSLADALLGARSQDGWVFGSFIDRKQAEADAWSHSQAMCALFHAPHLSTADLRALLPSLAYPFGSGRAFEAGGVPFGWPAHNGSSYSEAEPTLWTVAAVAAALSRPGAIPDAERPEWLRRLAYAQRAADLYRPLADGGWNMFPQQTDLERHNPYSTTLALLALLETHAAGLPWGDGVERRDDLLRSTHAWLAARFTVHGGVRGWRGTPDVSDPVSLGLTLQVVAEMLRAESQAGIQLPPAVRGFVPGLLESLMTHSVEEPYDAGESQVPFRDHTGRTDSRNESINFLWHPWAVDAVVRWLARPDDPGADPADRVMLRRALGHLVIDMGPAAHRAATSGFVFVASETLYGLSSVPAPAAAR